MMEDSSSPPPVAAAAAAARVSAASPTERRASNGADGVLGVSNEILAMQSPEGEQVAFGRVLKVRNMHR